MKSSFIKLIGLLKPEFIIFLCFLKQNFEAQRQVVCVWVSWVADYVEDR